MHVRKLQLAGFKSFVQPTELAIERGLTGIVGPNGCGKSNLVEALRWVMGEGSARGLRAGEMDDVIFSGTRARAPFDLAEVALHMTAGGVRIPGFEDAEELELTRRIGRGAGSAYRLNGRELRARDVQLLFADAASGARSAAIVSQGQISALVDARPAERRRLLEEAAGTAGLQARRHEAELKLRAAEANLDRLEDLLATLGEQHGQLGRQARQAKRYGEIGAKLRASEARLLVARWQLATGELEDAGRALESAARAVAEGDRVLEALRSERDGLRPDLAGRRQRAAALATEAARLAERLTATESARRERVLRLERLGEQRADHAADLEEAGRLIEAADVEATRLTAEAEAAERAQHDLATRKEEAARTTRETAAALARAEVEHRALVGRHGELQAGRNHLEEQRAALTRDGDALDAAARDLDRRRDALADDGPAGADDGQQEVARRELDAAEGALAQALARAGDAERNREAARDRLDEVTGRLRLAEEAEAERSRQRTAVAQARATLLDRRDGLAERRQRLGARRLEVTQRLEDARAAATALGLDDLVAEMARAEGEVARETDAEAAAGADLAGLETARDAAAERCQIIGREIERLTAEADALAGLIAGGGHASVMDAVEVDAGHADALAAALGDDLLAGLEEPAPAHWGGSVTAGDLPALPGAARPLREVVAAPEALRTRLAQVGVIEPADAPAAQPALRPGQRLVSRAGDLWRWDGFVRRAEALGPVAARLRHAARRRELDDVLGAKRAELSAAENDRETREEAVAAAARALEERRSHRRAAVTTFRDLERLAGERRSEAAALDAAIAGHEESVGALDAELAELEPGLAAVLEELALLPEDTPDHGGSGADALDALKGERVAAARADADAVEALEGARVELSASRERVDEARRALEAARAQEQAMESARRDRAMAEQTLIADEARLTGERTALAARRVELDDAVARLGGELRDAATALARSGETLERMADDLASAQRVEGEALAAQQEATERRHALAADLRVWRERHEAALTRSSALGEAIRRIDDEMALLRGHEGPADVPDRAELTRLEAAAREAEDARLAGEEALAGLDARIAEGEAARAEARERVVRAEASAERAETAVAEAVAAIRARPLPPDLDVPEAPPDRGEIERLEGEVARLSAARERLGAVNLRAVDELRELDLRLTTLQQERDELVAAIERLRRAITALNREGRERLKAAFTTIEKHFEALFARLFGGGQARLSLTDLEDPLAAGLELAASPPGKKLQTLSLLSGGEKALTAIALIFAVFLSRPSPLCVLDEVDAPLDDANVERFGHLLDELARSTDTRFMVVTHHPLTMAHMDRLYGVTMLERGVSELVSVDLARAVELRQSA